MENEALLTPLEARVIGALMEKELATPEYYPLTLASLVAACNQKSNRDPVMEVETKAVERVLQVLRQEKKLAVLVHEAGARVPKFEHAMKDRFGLSPLEQAVLTELILRGPQTLAELRTRVLRMVFQAEEGKVEQALESLEIVAGMPVVAKLPRAPGRRESRYAHQLCGVHLSEKDQEAPQRIEAPPSQEAEQIAALHAEVRELKTSLDHLREEFAEFKAGFE